MSYLTNATFRDGIVPWRRFNLAQNVATDIGRDGTAFSGDSFLRFQVSAQSGSVAVDFVPVVRFKQTYASPPEVNVAGFSFPTNLCAQVYIRTRPGMGSVSGTLAFWQLGLPAGRTNNPNTAFTVTDTWTLIFLSIDLYQDVDPHVRLEIYLDTLNVALDVGAVCVY